MARLFISHSSANNAAAFALREWLAEQGFDDVFLDVDPGRGLVAGERWQEALKAAADRCQAILFLVSPAWLDSKWCLAEFLLAKTLHKRIFGLIVEPVVLDRVPTEMTAEWQLCELIGGDQVRTFEIAMGALRQSIAFREAGLEMLRRGLERAGLDARSFPWPPAKEPDRAPYRGLRALEPEDAAIFFGRDAMIVRALDRIRGLVEDGVQKFLVVLGASGSGKSSFLRAGLLPRLARDDLMFLPLPVIRPETAVMTGGAGLAAALARASERFGAPRTVGRVKEMIAAGPDAVARLLLELAELAKRRLVHVDQTPAEPTIVLSIDQAEELFNPEGAEEAGTFLQLLGGLLMPAAGAAAPRIIVLVTIRSDRYELIQAHEKLADLKRELFDLSPIPPAEFKSVIEGPAQRVVEAGGRLAIDVALTEQLMADAGGADALPLLSFTLERLYADYGREGRLTLKEYNTLGGVQGSIEAAVAQALTEPGRAPAIPASKEDQLACLRAAFIPWLARIAPDSGVPMRRLARVDEIPEGSRTMVERLVAARLLVADRRAGIDVIEVAHESLLRRWPALASWLEADAGDLKVIEGVERAAGEWARNSRHDAWLDHRAERLMAAERLTVRDDFRRRLGEEGTAYLAACRTREETERVEKEAALAREQARLAEIAAAQTRTARVQMIARWSLGAAAVAVIIGLVLGMWQRHDNQVLKSSLEVQQSALGLAQTNLFVELAIVERQRKEADAALRFAVHAIRLDLQQAHSAAASLSDVELSTELSQAGWTLSLTNHGDSVGHAAFSPDGKRIVTAARDKTARIWDAITGRELAILRGHEGALWTAVFSPDGSRIVTASEDMTARIWDAATGNELMVLRGHGDKVTDANFNADGTRIVTGSFDKTARIWDAASGEEIQVLRGHDNTVQTAAFSPDGSKIVTASDDDTARIWDAASGREIGVLRGHDKAVYCAAFSPDGSRIVTGSDDTTVRIWDAASAKEMKVIPGHDDYVNVVDFSPDGKLIVSASADRTARIWDATTGAEVAVLQGHEDYVNSAAFSPDGTEVVTASRDATARVWPSFIGPDAPSEPRQGRVTSDDAPGDITGSVWRSVADTWIAVLRGHESWVLSAAYSADGAKIVTASQDKTARIWNASTGKSIAVLRGHEAAVHSARFSPDRSRIVTASEDKTARIWDAATGGQLVVLRGHTNWVLSAAFSPDGARVVTASWDGTARVFDAATGQEITMLKGHKGIINSAAFSADGSRIVTASRDKTARIWNAATGQQIAVLTGHDDAVYSAAFNADGTRIVTGSKDRTARIWDVKTAKEIMALRGHEDAIAAAAFNPDGTRIITASEDKTARIWIAATGKEIAVLHGHQNRLTSAAFSPDGSHAVTASRDMTARIWDVRMPEIPIEQQIADACAHRLGRLSILTRDDMQLAGFPSDAPHIDVCAGIK